MNQHALIDRFEKGAELVAYAAQGLSAEQLLARPGPGDWSIAELVVHLLDSDLVGSDRIKRVIAEELPVLQAYDENAWLVRLNAQQQPVPDAIDLFAKQRQWVTRLLRACSDSDFAREGTHTEDGRKTLADLLAGYVGHVDHHLKFLYAKRANLGVALFPRYSME
jgi:uncharacterized damage-inducible protein DinB